MKTIVRITILIILLAAGSAFVFQQASQADILGALITPTVSSVITPTPDATSGTSPQTEEDEWTLVWEGDPLPDDNQDECRSLRLMAGGQAIIGPCSAADTSVDMIAGQLGGWAEMVVRFAPFVAETGQGQVDFRGQGQIISPAWQRAIAAWAQVTHNELATGRVSATGRTVLSWWLGEVSDQPGSCRHLVVLGHGYAYSNTTPCEGGQVQEEIGGWLDTAEWEKFDTWLYGYGPVYQDSNYLDGQGTGDIDQAEIAALTDWAGDVYARLRQEATAQVGDEEAGCPTATAGTQLLRNPEYGYCLLYPAEYIVEKPNENETVLVVGSLLNVEDPRLHIKVSQAEGHSLEEVADQLETDYAVPGMEIERNTAMIGGQEAIVLDNVPGQDINRRLIFIHDGRLYSLMFAPASPDAGETYNRMEELYQLVVNSFTFLS